MHYLVLYSVNWKKNTKTVPSTSNTLLSHLIGVLLPSMKVEYIGTVFKLIFKTIPPSAHGSIMFCATEPPTTVTEHGNVVGIDVISADFTASLWFHHVPAPQITKGGPRLQPKTLADVFSEFDKHSSEFQHSSNKLNSLYTDTDNNISS